MPPNAQLECDLTVVVIARNEGLLLHRTLRSIQAALQNTADRGKRAELLVIAARPNQETKTYLERYRENFHLLETENVDTGHCRNLAVESAAGTLVCFVGASDLVDARWLQLACDAARQCTIADFAVHPAQSIIFGQDLAQVEYEGSTSPQIRLAELLSRNYWGSIFLASRSTLRRIPFHVAGPEMALSPVDRHWYCNLLAQGGQIVIAPQTAVFVRTAHPGLSPVQATGIVQLLPATRLLEPRFLTKAVSSEKLANQTHRNLGDPAPEDGSNATPQHDWLNDVAKRVSKLTEAYPPLQRSLGYVYRKVVSPVDPQARLPQWLLSSWKSIAEIEPGLFPDTETLTGLAQLAPRPAPEVQVYEELCRTLAVEHPPDASPQFTHVYLLPWLKRGGAEHVAIHYIQMAASCSENRVLVVLTEGSEDPWKTRVPASVVVLDYWGASQHLELPLRQRLLAQLLIQMQPSVIHIVSSQLGSQIYSNFGPELSQVSRLYAPAFCADVSHEGKLLSYVVTYLPEYAKHLTAIHADNQRVLDYLTETFAIDPAKMFVHYQPVEMQELPSSNQAPSRSTLHVLWAGRLDRQKRPDILLAIAAQCMSDDMHFHVFGSSLLPWDKAKVDFDRAGNVTYHGPFDGLASLKTASYDVFLYTSQWDGMPNILLEATAVGLPIVSAHVGGIGELIVPEETGLLVTPFDDVPQYVAALRRLQKSVDLRQRLLANCRRLVAQRHSWSHFAGDIDRFPGYCEHPIELANVYRGPVAGSAAPTAVATNTSEQPR